MFIHQNSLFLVLEHMPTDLGDDMLYRVKRYPLDIIKVSKFKMLCSPLFIVICKVSMSFLVFAEFFKANFVWDVLLPLPWSIT